MMRNRKKSILAMLLSLVMATSSLCGFTSVSAFAEDDETDITMLDDTQEDSNDEEIPPQSNTEEEAVDVLEEILSESDSHSQQEPSTIDVDAENTLTSAGSGEFDLSLMYADNVLAGDKDYEEQFAGAAFFGTVKIDPNGFEENPKDVTLKITVPKEYINRESLTFNMREGSISTFEDPVVEEDGNNYVLSMKFTNFDKTESFEIPFTMTLKNFITPQNTDINVNASITYNGKTVSSEKSLSYRAKYIEPVLRKVLEYPTSSQVQNVNVYVESEIINGKRVMSEDATVKYAFYTHANNTSRSRAASKIRIVDELPTYTDVYGNTRTAKFDPAKNPGWQLNSDGKSVYYELDVPEPDDGVSWTSNINQTFANITAASGLNLGFPGKVIESDSSLNEISNTATVEVDPFNPGPGETANTASSTLNLNLTSESGPVGNFTKTVTSGYNATFKDTMDEKGSTKSWTLSLRNIGNVPFTNIIMHDRKSSSVAGLDSRMKFTAISGANSLTSSGIDYIKVYYEDGTTEDITPTVSGGRFTVAIDDNKVATGFEAYFKTDFELAPGYTLLINAQAVLKNPENINYDEDDASKNEFTNEASVSYGEGSGSGVMKDDSNFTLNRVDEYLSVSKYTIGNDGANQVPGGTYRYQIQLRGDLQAIEDKNYGNIQIIDLLPNDIEYQRMDSTNAHNKYYFDTDYEPTIIENYQNTGRTAVIFEISQQKLMSSWGWTTQNRTINFYFYVKIKDDAHKGTVVNDVYASATDLDDLKDKTLVSSSRKVQDVNDLDRDGNTEEYIAHGSSNAYISASASMYSEKLIANKDQDNWNKNMVSGGPGDEIRYNLVINNEITSSYSGIVIYDVLPAIEDQYLASGESRNSNIHVALTGPISVPNGYTAYYTTSNTVYSSSMRTAVNANIWDTSVSDWSTVTAMKIVADNGVTLEGSSQIEVSVNAKLPETLTASQMNDLSHIGTNTFGYYTDQTPGVKESNEVKAELVLGSIYVKKINGDGVALNGVTFQLINSNGTVVATKTTDDNGEIVFTNLLAGTYTLRETAALTGYKKVEDIQVTMTQNSTTKEYSSSAILNGNTLDGRGTDNDPLIVVNEIETIKIEGTKSWDDADNQDGKRPNAITVRLYNGLTEVDSTTVTAANGWKYSFEVPKYENGTIVNYSVREDAVPGYTPKVTGYDISNSYTPETVTIEGSKTWVDNDNQDGVRPASITIHLLASGKEVASQTVTGPDWKWEFKDMPKYAAGQEITYTITEDAILGYTPEINGFNVTNSHTPGKTSVTVTKEWDDQYNQDGIRPESVTVKLIADHEATDKTVILSEDNEWTATFIDLDEKKAGQTILYEVEEETVAGYTPSISGNATTGYTIKNTHAPAVVQISGIKTWDDKNDQDGKRPESITVNLLADNEIIESVSVTEEDDWTYSFDNLPKFKAGQEIVYSITEDSVEDYTTTYSGYNITNSYTPGKTSVTVVKVWDDVNNKDGLRPDSIQIQLFANGEAYGDVVTLSAENNWRYTFIDLDLMSNKKEIVYSAKELTEVSGYTKDEGEVKDGTITITNTHTPKTVQNSSGTSIKSGRAGTGDVSRAGLLIFMLLLSVAIIMGLFLQNRKQK